MGKRLGLILAAFLILSVLGFGIRWVVKARQEKAQAEQSYQALAMACSKGVPIPYPYTSILDLHFEVLLSNPYGRTWIRRLEESYPSVAFHEKRNVVFCLYQEAKRPDHPVESSFYFIMNSGTGPGRARSGGGAQFPSGFLLKKVRVEGDQVVVDFEISKDEKKPQSWKENSFEPGGRYVTRMEIAEVLNPAEPATHIYKVFFPNARRQ